MLKWFRKLHVYAQMAFLSGLTGVLLLAFCFGAYRFASAGLQRQNAEYASGLTVQLRQTVENNYNAFQKIMRLISYNKDVQAFLLSADEAQRVERYGGLKRAISDVATLNSEIIDIIIETTDNQRLNLMDSLIILPDMELTDNTLHVSSLLRRRIINTHMDLIVMGKGIYSIDSYNQTNQRIGNVYLVLTSIAFTGTDTMLDDAGDMRLFLADGNGSLLWSSSATDTQKSFRTLVQEADRLYYYARTPLPKLNFTIVAAQENPSGALTLQDWQMGYLLALMALTLLLVLLWSFWARNLVSPLRRLQRFIERLKGDYSLGDLDQRVTLSGYQEAEIIGSEFNSLLEQTRVLTEKLVRSNSDLYESKLLAKQSELAYLRSQINPHFLYNTLETMVGIAYTNHQPEIAEIARSLSIIFKFSIKGENIVPLRSEFKIASNYVRIQLFRFSERFDVRYAISEDCMDLLVPKMILQPMIENAIVHGIEQQAGFCHLRVGAHKDEHRLYLTVQDDGAGIPEDKLAALNEKMLTAQRSAQSVSNQPHIGILNADSRIKLLYGAEYGITLASHAGRGTLVTITLPIQKEDSAP